MLKWLYVAIGVITWIAWAVLFFLVSPLLGIPALIVVAILTEALLRAARAEDRAGVDRSAHIE
jgi:hypothetical protein